MATFTPFTTAATPAEQAFNALLEQYNLLGQPSFMDAALSTLLDNIRQDKISGILPAFVDAARKSSLPFGTYVFEYSADSQSFRPATKRSSSSQSPSEVKRSSKTILEVKLQDGQTVETLTTAAEILGLPKDKREGVNSRNLWKALKEAGMTEKVASIKFGDHVDEETRRLFK